MRAREKPFDPSSSVRRDGLWSGLVKGRASVQVIDFDQNRASLGSAAAAQDGAHPLHPAPTQIGGDPNIGAQAQRISVPRCARLASAA